MSIAKVLFMSTGMLVAGCHDYDPDKAARYKKEFPQAATDLVCIDILVVWAVHHLIAVVLLQNLRVIADRLNVQVLPLVMKTIFLQDTTAQPEHPCQL